MTELEKTATALETEVVSIIRSSDYLNEGDVDEVAKMLLHRLAEMVNTDSIYEDLSNTHLQIED